MISHENRSNPNRVTIHKQKQDYEKWPNNGRSFERSKTDTNWRYLSRGDLQDRVIDTREMVETILRI